MTKGVASTEMTMRTERFTAFDLWLRNTLAQAAGSTVAEPLPEDLLRLLPKDDERSARR